MCQRCLRSLRGSLATAGPGSLWIGRPVKPKQTAGTDRPPRFLGNPKVPAPASETPAGPPSQADTGEQARPRMRARRGLPRRDQFRGWMGRLGSHAVYASPVQSPARTQDSLPVVGQTLPGGLEGPLGSSERFRAVSYISPPFPGLPWRKRASVRPTEVSNAD